MICISAKLKNWITMLFCKWNYHLFLVGCSCKNECSCKLWFSLSICYWIYWSNFLSKRATKYLHDQHFDKRSGSFSGWCLLNQYYTLSRTNPAESTPERSPVKIWSAKSLRAKKPFDFLPSRQLNRTFYP